MYGCQFRHIYAVCIACNWYGRALPGPVLPSLMLSSTLVEDLGNKAQYFRSQDTTDSEMLGVDPQLSTFDRYDA